ncbi:MAG: alpha-glucan family phosphorylase [Methanotrichaceae archaeon]|nr:alpha-glucan family phosphorylase [Methanotrichaceae archaeon]
MGVVFQRTLPEGLEGLLELALDLRWNKRMIYDQIWERLDPDAWERTHNPYLILQNISQSRLEEAAKDEELKELLSLWLRRRRWSMEEQNWFQENGYHKSIGTVAYFSMEFGLSEALPIYSGGLGILAGDHLKTASDMGVPVVGVGLLYQQGYFRQVLARDGSQIEAFPYNDPMSLPVSPALKPDGSWLRMKFHLPGRSIFIRVWEAQVGRVQLYLLDSNDPLNSPWDRTITANLYDPGKERRFIQEIILGFIGWMALEELGIEADVCHLNEGHAAFAVIARAYSFMKKAKVPISVALWATRAGNIFTTHTPVAAGFDSFEPDLIRQYAQQYADLVGVPLDQLPNLGRMEYQNEEAPLVMAVLAARGSFQVNGVSRLHGKVSQKIFQPLYPRWPRPEVPVTHVTNGVHMPSWTSLPAYSIWSRIATDRGMIEGSGAECKELSQISDALLWQFRSDARRELVDYVRKRLVRQLEEHAADEEAIRRASLALDYDALTVGFARRFAPYKRPTLLLKDRERLSRMLQNSERPVQLIVAGKAHPHDQEGRRLVQEMARFASRPEIAHRIVFLEDYDIALAQKLEPGVDLWINVPQRPMEACGTSGMKVLANGGLNLSELDGWWDEAYSPEVGWALGDGREHQDEGWDFAEADQLYRMLEDQVIPEFYRRDGEGIPREWILRVRSSMSRLTLKFSSYRMMREYVEEMYLPSATAFRRRIADGARVASELQSWQKELAKNWSDLYFGDMRTLNDGDWWIYEVSVHLGRMKPEMIRVELYADPIEGDQPVRVAMSRKGPVDGTEAAFRYECRVAADRPSEDFTPRIIPHHPEASVPIEDAHILWHH